MNKGNQNKSKSSKINKDNLTNPEDLLKDQLKESLLPDDMEDAQDAQDIAANEEQKDDEEDSSVEVSAEELEQFLSSVSSLAKEKEESEQRFLRLQADFDNFRKRSRQEKDDIIKNASKDLVLALLPVIDNFERALSGSDGSQFSQGVDMIYRQMINSLDQVGLQAMECMGQDFDPNYHDAVMQEEAEEKDKGKVILEIQKGYLFNDKLLRPAMVKVGI